MSKLNLMSFARYLLAAIALAGTTAFGQTPAGPPSSMNAVLNKLTGNAPFSAKAEIRVLDKSQRVTTTMPLNFSMLDNKTRFDVDMTQVQSSEIPANAVSVMKQVGLDKIIGITRPDRKSTLVVYPNLKAYTETPMTPGELADAQKSLTLSRTKLGRETIDGHACDKNKVVVTDSKNQKQNLTVWTAPDLKDFPLQLQFPEADSSVLVKFRDVKLTRPDAQLFEVPAGMTKYNSEQMMKKLSALGGQK